MRAVVSPVAAVLTLVVLAVPSVVLADGRVALVIGNGAYQVGRLSNPVNDAVDISSALGRLGFEVTTRLDAGRAELNRLLRDFARRSAGADAALVFYAGYGQEVDGVNYLLPVDAHLERATDIRHEAVTLDDVLAATTGASLRVVILDAARDDPLRRFRRTVTSAPAASALPLAAPLEFETLLAFSVGAGQVASDALGGLDTSRNSPFAAALLEYLETPVEVGLLFRQVRARVMQTTNGQQMPQVHMSLLREHYLSRPATAAMVEAVSPEAADVAEHAGRGSRNDAEAVAGRRVALVIGNAAYEEPEARLANSVGDARTVAEALNELHFDRVFLRKNLDREGMDRAVDDFIGQLRSDDVAVFYYAGHGLELDDGLNYLAPVDFSASYDRVQARNRSLRADEVQARMEAAGARTRIVILDACRDNPFERTRSLTRGGLGQMAPRGGLVAYATEAGDTAADSGLYARHLVAALRVPGVPAMELFTRVSEAVEADSGGAQVPMQQFGSAVGRFIFHPRASQR